MKTNEDAITKMWGNLTESPDELATSPSKGKQDLERNQTVGKSLLT